MMQWETRSNREKFWIIVIGLVIAVGLYNLATDKANEAPVASTRATVQVATPQTSPPVVSKDDTFLTMVHANIPSVTMSDGELLNFAYTICSYLDAGNSTDDVIAIAAQAAIDNGLSESEIDDLGKILGYAVGAYCPEYNF